MPKVPGTKYIPPEAEEVLPDSPPSALLSASTLGPYGAVRLLAGSASSDLGAELASHIRTKLSPCEITRFSNDNILIKLKKSVRGQDVYIIHSMASPVSDNIMELLIMLDTVNGH